MQDIVKARHKLDASFTSERRVYQVELEGYLKYIYTQDMLIICDHCNVIYEDMLKALKKMIRGELNLDHGDLKKLTNPLKPFFN